MATVHFVRGKKMSWNISVLRALWIACLLVMSGTFLGCQKDVPLPTGFANGEGTWCSPDITSARKIGDEALFLVVCEEQKNSARNQQLGHTANGVVLRTTITRRFNCTDRKIVESTVTVSWERASTSIQNFAETQQVIPNSPVEKDMNYACAQ